MSVSPTPSARSSSLIDLIEYCYASAHAALEAEQNLFATRLFGVLAAIAPTDERGWIGLAVTRERAEDWHAAAGLYSVGAALVPRSAWCHFGAGRALLRQGKDAQAEAAFRLAEALADDRTLSEAIEQERSAS